MSHPVPVVRQVVLDCLDARALAEFYRGLLGLHYRDGDDVTDPDRRTEWCAQRGQW